VFPARGPPKNRSRHEQGYAQLGALCVTVVVALLTGYITGLMIRRFPCFWSHENEYFDELFELNESENENEENATNVIEHKSSGKNDEEKININVSPSHETGVIN